MTLCVHCLKIPPCRPRGLCWTCYYTDGVREQYPSAAPIERVKYGVRGHGHDVTKTLPLDAEPTDTMPGTEERIAVYESRAARGFSLWHPGDRRYVGN